MEHLLHHDPLQPQPQPAPADATRTSTPHRPAAGPGEARRGRRATPPRRCAVCGDRAYSLHFGGLSCDSCKAFFRRSVQSRACLAFRCPHSRPCLVTVTSRRCCQACRYAKCLAAGMEPGWVLSEQERHQKVAKKCAESSTQDNKCGVARRKETCEQQQNTAELPNHLSPAELQDLNAIISAFHRACENCAADNHANEATTRVSETTNFPYHLTLRVNVSKQPTQFLQKNEEDIRTVVELILKFCYTVVASSSPIVIDEFYSLFESVLTQVCFIYVAAKLCCKNEYQETAGLAIKEENNQIYSDVNFSVNQSYSVTCPTDEKDSASDSSWNYTNDLDVFFADSAASRLHNNECADPGWTQSGTDQIYSARSLAAENSVSGCNICTAENYYMESHFIRRLQSLNMDDPTLLLLLVITLLNPYHPGVRNSQQVERIQEYYTTLLWHYLDWKHGSRHGGRILTKLIDKLVDLHTLTNQSLNFTVPPGSCCCNLICYIRGTISRMSGPDAAVYGIAGITIGDDTWQYHEETETTFLQTSTNFLSSVGPQSETKVAVNSTEGIVSTNQIKENKYSWTPWNYYNFEQNSVTNCEITHNSEVNSCFLDNKCETVIDEARGKTENVEDDLNFLENLFVQPEAQVLSTQHSLPPDQSCTSQWSSAADFQWNAPVDNNSTITNGIEVTSAYGETGGMQQLYTCPTTYLPDVY